jgi:hypothetical protein
MTMLDEAKTNGHAEPATRAWDARLVAIERRLAALPAEIAETGERRIVILRDALADFAAAELAKRDEEIVSLKKQQGRPKDCSTSSSNPTMEGRWCRVRREARARERHRHWSGG